MDLNGPNTADHLDAAADYMTTHGHCKDVVRDGQGRVCVVGALTAPEAFRFGSFRAALSAVGAVVGEDPIVWNNAPERTSDEVIQALRDTATKNRPDAMHSGGVA